MRKRTLTHKKVMQLVTKFQGWVDEGRALDEYDNNGLLWAMTNKEHGIHTHRYAKTGSTFTIDSYSDSVATSGNGIVDEEPGWLKRILDVAYLGGHGLRLLATPPDFVLWFETDEHLHLIRFIVEDETPEEV